MGEAFTFVLWNWSGILKFFKFVIRNKENSFHRQIRRIPFHFIVALTIFTQLQSGSWFLGKTMLVNGDVDAF